MAIAPVLTFHFRPAMTRFVKCTTSAALWPAAVGVAALAIWRAASLTATSSAKAMVLILTGEMRLGGIDCRGYCPSEPHPKGRSDGLHVGGEHGAAVVALEGVEPYHAVLKREHRVKRR